ncbi:MAG: hypothetical protein ACETWM_18960 [Candidatus Lokiarchaeia archaeon]
MLEYSLTVDGTGVMRRRQEKTDYTRQARQHITRCERLRSASFKSREIGTSS